MKKIIALLMCMGLSVTCFSGCTKQDEAFTQKSYTVDGKEVTEVNLEVQDRQIEVVLSTDDQIHIDYFENSKEYYEISCSEDRVLTMTAATDKEWTDYIGGTSSTEARKILVQLPDAFLTTLRLSTTKKDILLPALTVAGDLSLFSSGGNIVFEQLKVGNSIYLNAKNGDISGTILGNYEDYIISCESKKGESNLPSSKENGTKTLTVSNNNGDVAIEFVGE